MSSQTPTSSEKRINLRPLLKGAIGLVLIPMTVLVLYPMVGFAIGLGAFLAHPRSQTWEGVGWLLGCLCCVLLWWTLLKMWWKFDVRQTKVAAIEAAGTSEAASLSAISSDSQSDDRASPGLVRALLLLAVNIAALILIGLIIGPPVLKFLGLM